MANEGIMAMPQGMPMQGEEPVDDRPVVSSAQSYDAAQTVLKDRSPQEYEMLKEAMRQNLADIELSPNQLATVLDILVFMSQRPAEYVRLRQKLIDSDFLDPEDLPEEYDAEFIGAAISMLNELQLMQAQGAQDPMMDMPPVEGADAMQGLNGGQPLSMAQGGLADVAAYLASQGRNGDSILAHITPQEARLLKDRGGAGSINPVTGLPEYFFKKLFKSVAKAVKNVVKSPVGRILATVALATVLGPGVSGLGITGLNLSAGVAGGLAASGVTLALGGSVKQALVAGATGFFGAGGTVGGFNPVTSLGSVLPGAAGSALNTGLSTGLMSAGIGKLSGMSTQEALKAGLVAGGSAAALSGLKDAIAEQDASNLKFGEKSKGGDSSTGNAGNEPAPGFFDEVTTGAKKLYKDYFSPSEIQSRGALEAEAAGIKASDAYVTRNTDAAGAFTGSPALKEAAYQSAVKAAMPGVIATYGPLAAAGTVAAGALGAFKSGPAEASENPLFDRKRTGEDYIRENPGRFSGGLDTGYRSPTTPINPIDKTNFAALPPTVPPSQIVPTGSITNSPAGVPQPYNVAGMYGVPLIYGQGSQPQQMAKGGEPRSTRFPRKTGPVNGPGTGTSDDIPAMLSDGEFVFTAKAVRNAGNGSRRKGAARMYKLMKMLEGGSVKGK